MLGICYGLQLAAHLLGGEVKPHAHREFGHADLRVSDPTGILAGVPDDTIVWMSHGDQVVPHGDWVSLAATATCPVAAARHTSRPIHGLQFHPEVSHTREGSRILRNFLYDVCGCRGTWQMSAFIDRTVADIRERVGQRRVICGLSGGVDSSVVAALLFKAIGQQVACIFVDNGLLRQNELEAVKRTFQGAFGLELHAVNAQKRFLDALAGVADPQKKRTIIGHVFIDVFRDEARTINDAAFLAQGTLYPDVIESGGSRDGPAATIKTHHNVGGLPAELGFELIELGVELGLPEQLVWRHPVPGPGRAVRCLGPISEDKLNVLRKADTIFLEELKKSGWYRQTSQAFAVLLPIQSVGVMGDGRTYEQVIALRAVRTDDFMTADWSRLPDDLLARVSTRIINEVRGVNRVVYDISSKPPATIEWE